jgi:hypothetical protein
MVDKITDFDSRLGLNKFAFFVARVHGKGIRGRIE